MASAEANFSSLNENDHDGASFHEEDIHDMAGRGCETVPRAEG